MLTFLLFIRKKAQPNKAISARAMAMIWLLSDMLNDPPMVEAINNKANADRDKTPMILAMITAAVLSFGKNKEAKIKTLNAENNIGHILKPNTSTP